MRASGSMRKQRAKRAVKVRFHRVQRQKQRVLLHRHRVGEWWIPNINERHELRMFRTNTEGEVA